MNGPDPFPTSRARFEALARRLSGKEALALTHSELEGLIQTEGEEMLRQLLAEHLARRAAPQGPGHTWRDRRGEHA